MKQGIFIIFLFLAVMANGQVNSELYGIVLKTLLSHDVTEVSVDKVDTNATMLDSRSKEEFAVSHLKNAIWVGFDDFDSTRVASLDKAAPVIVYCSIGYRSEKIAQRLVGLGFTNVQNLYGGIFEWINQDQVVYQGDSVTKNVHPYSAVWGIWLQKGNKTTEP